MKKMEIEEKNGILTARKLVLKSYPGILIGLVCNSNIIQLESIFKKLQEDRCPVTWDEKITKEIIFGNFEEFSPIKEKLILIFDDKGEKIFEKLIREKQTKFVFLNQNEKLTLDMKVNEKEKTITSILYYT